jgi:hypothetical protein
MLTPSNEIILLLNTFAVATSAPTFKNICLLVYGAILAPGRRTITAALRVLGIQGTDFCKFHRVFSRNRWSPMRMSRLLLGLLIGKFLPSDAPIVVDVDETLERRQGKKIVYKGWFRDAVRSTANKVVTSLGIRWLCATLLVKVPWSQRPWALPFWAVPVLSEKTCEKLKKRHRSGCSWTAVLARKLRFWYPERAIHLVGDGGFASVMLVAECQCVNVNLVSRLRLDAGLYDFAGPRPAGKRGPNAHKGQKQPTLAQRALDPKTIWCRAEVNWYGGGTREVFYVMGVSLWYTPGQEPVGIRWVLVRYAEKNKRTGKQTWKYGALFCSDTQSAITAEQIIDWFVGRWNIEVTFEEVRAHLGFETQRHWSRRAIERTAPCLLGLFSLVVLMAATLHPETLPIQQDVWYHKDEATFSDALAAVREDLWTRMNYTMSSNHAQLRLIPTELWRRLQQVVCYA